MKTVAREIVSDYSARIEDPKIFFAPGIPSVKLRNAISRFAPNVAEMDALVLLDGSVFGSAKIGGLLTEDSLYFRNPFEQPQRVALADMADIAFLGSSLHGNGFKFKTNSVVPCMRQFGQMLRDIGQGLRRAEDAPMPGEVRALEEKGPQPGDEAGPSPTYLPRIVSFLRDQFEGHSDAFMAPDIPDREVRVSCRVPENDKLLAFATPFGSTRAGVAFTDRGIYVKRFGADPVSLPYPVLPACTYTRIREVVGEPVGSLDTAAVCQQVKTIVMYGSPDFRKPPDPDKDPHPVRSWLTAASSFVLLVLIIPWLAWEAIGPKTGYPALVGFSGLASALSWLVWFYSHQVSAKKSEYFSFSTRLKRAAFGGMVAASILEYVLGNKVASGPGDSAPAGPYLLLGLALLGGTVCVFLFFNIEKWIHDMQRSSRCKGVAARYMENKRSSGIQELPGLIDAGVCELSDDTEIRKVCRIVAEHSAHPLGPYQNLLADVDLMAFFEYARDYGYDFSRHGSPDEIVREIRRGERGGPGEVVDQVE